MSHRRAGCPISGTTSIVFPEKIGDPPAVTPSAEMRLANGLPHRVLTWRPPSSSPLSGTPKARVVLLHGFADSAANWDLVAPAFANAGYVVHAPDFRGYGESAWVPEGGYYHFADHVFDLADLVSGLEADESLPLHVVGHSMGGTVATLYAGTFPEKISRLVLCEGLGPPDNELARAPDRMRGWIEQVRKVKSAPRGQKPFDSLAEAAARMRIVHATVPEDVLLTRAAHLVKVKDDGRVAWAFDPLHRTASPNMFSAVVFKAFASRIACPVLFVDGGREGFHPDDEADRLTAFGDVRTVSLPSAGHMMHWTAPSALASALLSFFES